MPHCTRCNTPQTRLQPIYKVHGHTSLSASIPETLQAEVVCADCITDKELAQMLHPAVSFVLNTMRQEGSSLEHSLALELVSTYFLVHNNEDDGRRAALRAAGLLE